ncbi:sulfatase-like hydrolase/transferase [Patiriisocius hiemis]|uniref:Sulfatase-like hydrolase/transferase n=1 Tax=Patiriisocius hiemis TaxID=3075604 RepID=A0ABU2YEW0_9FLAO|nr:sulfatase-like hydrolase/transferase [Constantimarinum sp. W242]MDT0556729.1 sulfatase-like hydrolase/transferase [Constantimarinum sp. W242]
MKTPVRNTSRTKIKELPFYILGIATGLYPILFYYSNNYSLINSWKHLGFFIALFIVVPIVAFFFLQYIFKKYSKLEKYKTSVFAFCNALGFLLFIQLCLYASLRLLFTVACFIIAFLIAKFLNKHLLKIVVFQFLIAFASLFTLIPTIINQLSYNEEWLKQPDNIEEAVFTKRPNVYYIQPDGYVNFSEINKGYYDIDNSKFKDFLTTNNFKLYPDIRSNYTSTLVSNSATFSMKHHYYNRGFNFSETANAREIIISKNPVLDIFKNNNYKTHYLAEVSYILNNFPKMGYDACNFSYEDISFITDGFQSEEDITVPLIKYLNEDEEKSKFFFIEIFKPGHVESDKNKTLGKEAEYEKYKTNLKMSNERLVKVINLINEKDPNGLIIIMADHGGYAGMEYMLEVFKKTNDRDKLYSAFSTILAIKWPDNTAPAIDKNFKTGVNLYRILFSYLTDNTNYLKHLQEDASYSIIDGGAPKGVYKRIDSLGNIVFERVEQ